jgi:hypothetical protein
MQPVTKNDVPCLQDELDRKVLDTLDKLSLRYNTGQINEAQLGESIASLYCAVFGLVTDKSLEEIMNAYEPTVTVSTVYFLKMRKSDSLVFVTWATDDEAITVHDAHTGAEKRYAIPTKDSPHEFYNRITDAMRLKGWRDVNNNEEASDDK